MPLYEFRCDSCEKNYDAFQSMDALHRLTCPECGKQCRRLYHAATTVVEFKYGWDEGLGMYIDTKKQRNDELRKHGFWKDRS